LEKKARGSITNKSNLYTSEQTEGATVKEKRIITVLRE
jgi:hypothetical protein